MSQNTHTGHLLDKFGDALHLFPLVRKKVLNNFTIYAKTSAFDFLKSRVKHNDVDILRIFFKILITFRTRRNTRTRLLLLKISTFVYFTYNPSADTET